MRYFSNTSWLLVERFIQVAISTGVGIYVARYLGPSGLGVLSYAQSLVAIIAVLPLFGTDTLLVRELVRHRDDPGRVGALLGTTFVIRAVGFVLMYGPLCLVLVLSRTNGVAALVVLIVSAGQLGTPFGVIDGFFQAKVASKFAVYARLAVTVVSAVVKIALVWTGASLVTFAGVVVLDALVLSSGLLVVYRQWGGRVRTWTVDAALARRLLKDAWPLMLASTVVLIHMRIDQVMIKEMLNLSAVGQYAAAVKLTSAAYMIPMAVASSLFPLVVKNREKDRAGYLKLMQRLIDGSVWGGVLIALPIALLSPTVIPLLFGHAYDQAGTVLVVQIWSTVFVFIGVSSGKWLMAENHTRHIFTRNLLGAMANVGLNLWLIPVWGINGAAVATVAAQALANYVYDPFFSETRGMFWMKTRAFFPVHLLGLLKTRPK